MSSLFKWVVGAISSTTNSAAETLLSNIIKRFLEEPIQNDALKIELFNDWTLHLNLKRSFLNVNLVNSYITFVKFTSIYFADIKFDAKYNLSNFLISLARVVIECDLQIPESPPPVDENLTESIHVFQEQLPIEKGKSFKDWIIDCVQKVNLSLDFFTIILYIAEEYDKVSVVLESLTLNYQKDIELVLPKASLIIGQKRNQKSIADIINFSINYKSKNSIKNSSLRESMIVNGITENVITISIDSITIFISESIIKTLFALIQAIPKSKNTNSHPNEIENSSNEQINANFILKKLQIKLSNTLTLELSYFKLEYRNGSVKMSFNSVLVLHNDVVSLAIESKSIKENPNISLVFPDFSRELSMFNDFPNRITELIDFDDDIFNSQRINVVIPSILLNISQSLIISIFEVIQWVSPLIESSNPSTLNVSKQSYIFYFDIHEFITKLDNLQLIMLNPSISLFYSQTAANTHINSIIKLQSLDFFVTENMSLINFFYKETISKSFLFAILSYKQQLGNDKEIDFDVKFSDFLLRIPSNLDFIDQITKFLDFKELTSMKEPIFPTEIEDKENNDENENNSENNDSGDDFSEPNIRVSFNVKLEKIFVDYFTLNMPARALILLPSLSTNGNLDTAPFQLKTNIDLDLKFFLSNHRDDLPISLFRSPVFQFGEFNFAPIATLYPTSIMIVSNDDSSEIVVDNANAKISCCFDSIRLLIAFLMHIQYKLDNTPENQTKTRQFDLPQTLLDMTTTLNQSLQLNNFKYNPLAELQTQPNISAKPQQFDTIENLIATVYRPDETDDESYIDQDLDETVSINSDDPITQEKVIISIQKIYIEFSICGGKDFDQIYDLQPLKKNPKIFDDRTKNDGYDFDFISTRDESNSLDIEIEGNAKISLYNNDPTVSMRILVDANKFNIKDNIPTSSAKIMLGIEDDFHNNFDTNTLENSEKSNSKNIKCKIDILSTTDQRMELSFKLELPNLFMFITQDQINFFMNIAQINLPTFPSDLIVDEPLAFQLFELKPSDIQIAAHFRLWLDIHMDDIRLHVPKCQLFAIRGFDELIGGLAEFYVSEMSRPGAAAVVGGLPVIKNMRRIGGAVRDLFKYDVQRFGVGVGFAKSFSALMQIIAMETLNMGANVTSIAERFLYVAMKILGGKDNAKDALNAPMATLVIQAKNPKKAVQSIPTMILAPGVLSLKKLTDLMKGLRNRLNPNYTKTMKNRK
ncbi:hypothetical protein TRFO_21360 [Tritrichomonas foetus]|uniref:Autophagy-related protein 2 n=1 Tax=Tritrichomonas foetus TaxID=1144522 RepID=A0A1J4KIY7_9EUKA|nr:hypothetical protein TRFO_21360 [Tritrichomonas foetus]|eukprot:OHT09646.1 hypothetical protein TRFO_21360 [Tritrichomonas foetus]